MTFDQEAHPRLRFAHNVLKVVVAQVRFPTAYPLADPAVQARLQQALLGLFPKPLPPAQEIMVSLTPRGPEQIQAQQSAIRFADESERTIVSIGPGAASLETSDYPGWEVFAAQFWSLLRIVEEHGRPAGITRFGLRYVDEIGIPGIDDIGGWARALQASLIGADDSLARDPRLVRSQQRVTIPVGDDVVNVVHGMVRNPTPGADSGSVYVVDSDAFTEAALPWDVVALAERAERYHRWMTNIFVRSLTPEGIGLMGGTER